MTVRAHPLCIGAWSLCFHAIFSGYANIVQYSGITIQYNCILHTRSSLHISVSNMAYLHCISFSTTFFFKPKIILVNNQRVLNPNNHNIFKCDIPSMVAGLQGPWNDTGCNMNVFPPGMSSVAVSWVAPHTLQVLPNRNGEIWIGNSNRNGKNVGVRHVPLSTPSRFSIYSKGAR